MHAVSTQQKTYSGTVLTSVSDIPDSLLSRVSAVAAILLALVTYLHGLGSLHIMGNGDEMVYAQITRATAASGHWLPLVSEMPDMVNTKPPLLFWQGILTTDWGHRWNLVSLRWPSLVWTFLAALLAGLVAWRTTRNNLTAGLLAASLYLGFLSTYRYGRPFLTNPPETFWVFFCFFAMLKWRPFSFSSRLIFPTLIGSIAGFALLTKSFAQLLPIGVALTWWHLSQCRWNWRTFFFYRAPSLAWTATLALGIFSLWFVLDPNPAAIWKEFVVGENIGKMASSQSNYLLAMLWGRTSIWGFSMGWFLNAGFLAFPLLGTMIRAWQHRSEATQDEKLLWILTISFFLVFCIPTQRSGRYLLEVMPAIAVLMVIHWRRLLPQAFLTTLIAAGVLSTGVAWVSLTLARETSEDIFNWWHWPILIGSIALPLVAFFDRFNLDRYAVPSTLCAYLSLSSFVGIFDGPSGRFSADAIAVAANRVVWVPENFRAAAELERTLLPGARVRGYDIALRHKGPENMAAEDLVLVILPLSEAAPPGAIGSRIELISRHSREQLFELAQGRIQENLFCKQWLLTAQPVENFRP